MHCPFGYEVGDPPTMLKCPKGFPGCACADEFVFDASAERTDQTDTVMEWWKEHDAL